MSSLEIPTLQDFQKYLYGKALVDMRVVERGTVHRALITEINLRARSTHILCRQRYVLEIDELNAGKSPMHTDVYCFEMDNIRWVRPTTVRLMDVVPLIPPPVKVAGGMVTLPYTPIPLPNAIPEGASIEHPRSPLLYYAPQEMSILPRAEAPLIPVMGALETKIKNEVARTFGLSVCSLESDSRFGNAKRVLAGLLYMMTNKGTKICCEEAGYLSTSPLEVLYAHAGQGGHTYIEQLFRIGRSIDAITGTRMRRSVRYIHSMPQLLP
jgi:hypothetical protein